MRNYLTNFWIKAILIILAGLLVYLPLLNGYFIQEEWHLLLNYNLKNNDTYLNSTFSYFIPEPGQYIPITQIVSYSVFYLFKTNYLAYLLTGLLLHMVVGFLLFIWFFKITKMKMPSLIVAFIFIIAPNHFQATSWIMANIGYTLSAICMIAGFIYLSDWLETKKVKFAILSSLLITLSLLAKDISIFALLFLPVMALSKKYSFQDLVKSVPIILPGFLLEAWHFWYLRTNPYVELLVNTSPSWQSIVTLPMRSIAESIIPQHTIYWLSKAFLLLFPPYSLEKLNTTVFNQQVESTGAFVVVFLVTLLFIIIGIKLWKLSLSEKRVQFNFFLMGGFLATLASLPYFFVDTKNFSLLQPRYIYIPLMGICLAAIPLINISLKRWPLKSVAVLFIIVASYLISTWKMSEQLAITGYERRTILESISRAIPLRSTNTIFYIESDTSFYGLPDDVKTLPFQIGPGKVLAAYLNDKVYLPKEVYDYFVFLEIGSEGFFSDENGSYGYFRNYNNLLTLVKNKQVKPQDVYSFRYIRNLGNVVDITDEIRDKLKGKI